MLFDVAVWQVWSDTADGYISTPEVEVIDAPDAFSAVERVMRSVGLRFAGHVAAAALDRSIVYRGCGVSLVRRGGGNASQRAVVKHRWELEAGGRPAWVEQAASTSWPLTQAGRLGRREGLVHGGGQGCGGQCSTRSLSADKAFPARVKGDATHPGGAQVVRGTTRPR